MDTQSRSVGTAFLIVLLAVLGIILRAGPQNASMDALRDWLEEASARLKS